MGPSEAPDQEVPRIADAPAQVAEIVEVRRREEPSAKKDTVSSDRPPSKSASVHPQGPSSGSVPGPSISAEPTSSAHPEESLAEVWKEKVACLKKLDKQVQKANEIKSCASQTSTDPRSQSHLRTPSAQERLSFEDTAALARRLL